MSRIIVPSRRVWTRQPPGPVEVDLLSPLARDLVVAATPYSDFATRPELKHYIGGAAMRGGVLRSNPILAGVAKTTVLCIDIALGADGGGFWGAANVVYGDTAAGWPNDKGVFLRSAKSYGVVAVGARDSSGTIREASIDVTPSGGMPTLGSLVRAVTIDETLMVAAYGNGDFCGSSSALQGYTFPSPAASSSGPKIGTQGFTSGDTVTYQSLILRWSRVLSHDEIRELSANPWQIFKPRRRVTFHSLGAPAAASLEGHAQAQAAASGNLTLSASLDGLALSVTTATGNLTTQIPLAGAAVAVVSANGNLLTGIRLSASAVATAVAAGNLSAQIRLDGAALAQAAASAGLTSAILLAGSAQGQAAASGALTSESSGLAGDANAAATAIATLTTSIRLSGSAAAAAGVNGLLTTQVPLTAAALAQAIATGTLSVAILLAGEATAEASASGVLGDAAEPEATVHFRLSADVARITRVLTSVTPTLALACEAKRATTLIHEVRHA